MQSNDRETIELTTTVIPKQSTPTKRLAPSLFQVSSNQPILHEELQSINETNIEHFSVLLSPIFSSEGHSFYAGFKEQVKLSFIELTIKTALESIEEI